MTPPSKVGAFPGLFTLLAIISPAWAQATGLKEMISFKKEVCAPPCLFHLGYPQGKVKERSGFRRNWARGAQRVSASLGEERGRCFLQNEHGSHQSCAAPFAQMSFLKKHTRNELKGLSQSRGTPAVTQPQGAGWWQNPPSISRTRWHVDVGQWGGCFCHPHICPPCCYPLLASPWCFQRYCKKGRKEGQGGERLRLCGEPITIRAGVNG